MAAEEHDGRRLPPSVVLQKRVGLHYKPRRAGSGDELRGNTVGALAKKLERARESARTG
jgi:hypothetical protein